ncbi:unnamed protein product [Xylocopa violacea]|uniref:Sperm-tail PG-rich repeat-containing protein 2 n=1 Tax=Xylocopa violacea TaxID=135666 RepID=A0ABP1NQI4_XYLVO
MTGRTELRRFLTPGPGDYQHEKKKTASQIQDEKIREERRMSSRQPRFLDTLYRRKMRENFPAPNCYKVKGAFDKYFKIRCKCDPYALEPPPFGQTAKRFDDKIQSDIPGPGTYDPPKPIKCTGSIYPAPFGVCSVRFKKDPDDNGPGPGDYHLVVGNLAYELQKRFKYTLAKPIYPQTYFDEIPFYEDEEDYNVICSPERTEEKKSSIYHAAFKSRTERFPKPEKTDVPDSGAYEVLTAFKATRDKCDFLCRRLAPPFGTRSSRLPKRIEVVAPDPTTYYLATDISENVRGGVINPSPRRTKAPSLDPGPAHYCIHPYLSSTLLKRSFNVTLGKPKVIANLAKQEKHKGSRCPRTRKKLGWFAKSIRERKTCRSISF